MKDWTLGTKLTAWSALVLSIALLITGIGAGLFIQQEQIEALDDQLFNEAHTFFGEVARQGGKLDWTKLSLVKAILPLTRTERFIEVVGPDGQTLYSSNGFPQVQSSQLTTGMRTLTIGRHAVRIGTFERNGLKLHLGAALNEIEADASQLTFGLFVGLPLLVATIVGGGWWLAEKALGPLRNIIVAAEEITAERLHRRLLVPRARDEIGRLSEVLNAMFDRLDTAFRQAIRFSADASHELKTPLTVLRAGIDDLLESPTLSPQDQRAVAALLDQTHRLSSIIETLLLLSRADGGRLNLDLADTEIGELITLCVEDAQIMAERRKVTITVQMASGLRASLDTGRFSQILSNLLDNSVKYNREGGKVTIFVETAGGRLTISVANTGLGIPPDKVPQLFERFYRSDPHPDTPGHGLGLSLARELARAHGGDVELTHSDPEWTIFTLRLVASPLLPASPPDSSEEAKVEPPWLPDSLRALLAQPDHPFTSADEGGKPKSPTRSRGGEGQAHLHV